MDDLCFIHVIWIPFCDFSQCLAWEEGHVKTTSRYRRDTDVHGLGFSLSRIRVNLTGKGKTEVADKHIYQIFQKFIRFTVFVSDKI